MAKDTDSYRLWKHDTKPPKKSDRTIIAKVTPTAPVRGAAAATLSGSGRAAKAVGVAPDSGLTRLLENARISNMRPVLDVGVGGRGGDRKLSMFSGSAEAGRRGFRRDDSRDSERGAAPGRLVEITVARGATPAQVAAHMARMPDVEYAFVPPVRTLFGRRTRAGKPDPMASRQWAHGAIRLGQARAAAGFKNATGLTVAVVDSGIDERHPDLKPVIAEYKNFIGGSKKDFVGHGTHVAGIVAAAAGNGLGVSGVCGAKILALKALPRDGEEFDAPAYYQALRYVIGKAQVLNLSLGGDKDPAEIDVLRDVIAAGVVVIAAMGNEYEEGNPVEYPAAIRDVCAVGATDQFDKRASFSNTGKHIDLVAPGVAILSTTPTFNYDDDGLQEYDSWDGTSMATPHVAAAAALVLAQFPGSTPEQVITRLIDAADRVAGAKKGSVAYGAGRLNCEKLLGAQRTPRR
jgi:subtilisin family serine protease